MAKQIKLVKISDITRFADSLARSIRTHLRWSKQLRKAVAIGKGVDRNGVVSIEVTVGKGDKDLSGMAKAFEYGSGIHATRGKKGKYLIQPKNKRALWFPYPSPKVFPGTMTYIKNGQFGVTTLEVRHPGVAPRPFLAPAIESTKKKAIPDLQLAIKKNLTDSLRATIKQIGK